jgi:hypothetical protein
VSGNAGGYRRNETYMPTLRWRHDGPVWKAEAGAGYSRARYNGGDLGRGYFANSSARRTGVTVAFDDIFYLRPNRITVTDGATGAPIDPYALATYAVQSAGSGQPENNDQQRTAFLNVGRDLPWRVPVSLRAATMRRRPSGPPNCPNARTATGFPGSSGSATRGSSNTSARTPPTSPPMRMRAIGPR